MPAHKLTRDVPNPKHDGRRRYGLEAVKTFKAGTVFHYHPMSVRPSGDVIYAYVVIQDRSSGNPELIDLLMAASEPLTPATWTEVLAQYEMDAKYAAELIDKLITTGALTLAQVDAAAAAVRADYDAC